MIPDAPQPPDSVPPRETAGSQAGRQPGLLLAEPDEKLAAKALSRFQRAGVHVVVCHDGAEALLQVGSQHPDAVLLAAPLPVIDAAAVTGLIARLHPVPVMVGAGPDGAEEATAALAAGAVAFVARPYRVEEILPWLSAGLSQNADPDGPLVVGDIELDPISFHVYVRGRPLDLPVREFLLLRYLMEHASRVISRRELTQALWGSDALDSNTLTVHVRRVRNKLRDTAGSCCTIDAIRGMGYRLECTTTATVPGPGSVRPAPTR
ncbi:MULTISPECIES: response regulator transcription factor [Streptomyces]|uniref:winged helix-turn-helix transcriptional regulator n=1 Tax=Streptomyces TaxID=1883 RepID=UPI00205113D3|nr:MULTISPECIES: response regulator transcription factor [Streptomyces]UPT43246.1 response regulator transcription factor [Streptomyces sp. WAC00303]WIY77442.1 response regulator transcription factor [Streptomyces anulatus]